MVHPHLTLSGMSAGAIARLAIGGRLSFPPWCHMPFFLSMWLGLMAAIPPAAPPATLTELQEIGKNGDLVDLLSESEALEFTEFDPSIKPQGTWDALKQMLVFMEHFNRSLSNDEREAILKDFPKPNSLVLEAPHLDDPETPSLIISGNQD